MKEITSLEEMRCIELEIMKKVHQFCTDNNLQYFLSYGTLIGAIRHNGFIPWDDDIDILMPRPEYEKFCKLFCQFGKDVNLAIVNDSTVPQFKGAFSKVIDTRTSLEELSFKDSDPIGVFIDVFPLDGVAANSFIRRVHYFICKFFCLCLVLKKERKWRKNIVKVMLKCMLSLVSYDFIIKMLKKLIKLKDYEDSEYVTCFVDPYHAVYKKSDFSPELHQFEDSEFRIPSGYDAILRGSYGDYMTLPPIEKRIPHHISNTYWK